MHELLKNPELRDWLEEDWSRVNLAVEELLRFLSPVQGTKPRYIRKDIEIGGVRLKKGEKIMAMLVAANLDPQANAHPENSISSASRTGILPSAPAFTSASAISSRASREFAR